MKCVPFHSSLTNETIPNKMKNAYNSLLEIQREISFIQTTAATLSWDQETFAPKKSVEFRAKQLSYLAGKAHTLSTSSQYKDLLESAESETPQNNKTSANLREWRHSFDLATKLPIKLIEKDSETSSIAKSAWSEAKSSNNFSTFAPHFEKLLDIAKEKADLFGYEDEPYDALVSTYERGSKTSEKFSTKKLQNLSDLISTQVA